MTREIFNNNKLQILYDEDEAKISLGYFKDKLTDLELANLRRSVAETAVVLLMFMLAKILSGNLDDEEEDSKFTYYALYWALRLRQELSFYYDPVALTRVTRSPSVAYTTLESIMRLVYQAFDPMEEYVAGKDKGRNKFWIKLLRFMGLTGYSSNPDEAVKILQMY
jgi:hypothetical protein